MSAEFQGWTNQATWLVNNWLLMQDILGEPRRVSSEMRRCKSQKDAAQWLYSYVEGEFDHKAKDALFWLARASFLATDWFQLAASWLPEPSQKPETRKAAS